jgi:hypothetical protein
MNFVIDRTPIGVEPSVSTVRRASRCLLVSADLGAVEFQGLWRYIKDWQDVFRHFDRDHSGSIDGRELAAALNSFGYKLSPMLLSLVEQKYGERGLARDVRVECAYSHPCSLWAYGGGLWPCTRHHLRSVCEGLCSGKDFDGGFPIVS